MTWWGQRGSSADCHPVHPPSMARVNLQSNPVANSKRKSMSLNADVHGILSPFGFTYDSVIVTSEEEKRLLRRKLKLQLEHVESLTAQIVARQEQLMNRMRSEIMEPCKKLLKTLASHKYAWVFNEPVDAVKLDLHDYHEVIKMPMDLGTIRDKLDSMMYSSPSEFSQDVRLTFSNAMTYNPSGHDVHVMASVLLNLFEKKWNGVKESMDQDGTLTAEGQSLGKQSQSRAAEGNILGLSRQNPRGRRPLTQPKPRRDEVNKRSMTINEKKKLTVALENLPSDKVVGIVQIVKKFHPNLNPSEEDDEIELDLDAFDNDTLWELNRFVTNWAKSKGKAKKKAPPRESTLENDSLELRVKKRIGETPKKVEEGGGLTDIENVAGLEQNISQHANHETGETPKKVEEGGCLNGVDDVDTAKLEQVISQPASKRTGLTPKKVEEGAGVTEEEDVNIGEDTALAHFQHIFVEKDASDSSSSSGSSSPSNSSSDFDSSSSSESDSVSSSGHLPGADPE